LTLAVIKETGPNYESKPRLDIPERLLANLWLRRAAQQASFRSQDGLRVRVLYPGRPGHTAGPDFRDALLEVEGVGLVQGDVEIHLRQRDWKSHGHGGDPRYNGVVLHAALEVQSATTRLQSGQSAPVISLASLMEEEDPDTGDQGGPLWEILSGHGYPKPGSAVEMGVLLDRAGDERFAGKSRVFQSFLAEQDPDQTLYEGLMEGLGYRQNQHAFLLLAQRAGYGALHRAAIRLPAEERAPAIEHWLVTLSGLFSPEHGKPETLPRAGFGPPLSAQVWHCFRVRPANHPLRRIAGAARLVARFLHPELVEELRQVAASGKPALLTAALAVASGPAAGPALVGIGRARDLAVNVVLPCLHGLAEMGEDARRAESYLELYHRFGKLQDNELTREMTGQLVDPRWAADPPKAANNARRQQGLLHLKYLLSGVV